MNTTETRFRLSFRSYLLLLGSLVVGFCWWVIFGSWDAGELNQQSFLGLLDRFTPADFSSLGFLLGLIVDTLSMALMGTSIGFLSAIPLAALSSSKLTKNVFVRTVSSSITAFFRAVPDLVFALVAVVVFGFGYLAGAIALATATTGMLAKLFAELFENNFDASSEPIRALGANSPQVLFASLLRVNLTAMISLAIYRLDINFRSATTLGLVGAGGIGLALRTSIGSLDYRAAAAVLILIIAFVIIFETLSGWIRRTLEQDSKPSRFILPFVLIAVFIASVSFLTLLLGANTEGRSTNTLVGFLEPDFSSLNQTLILTVESLTMTVIAISVAFLLGPTLGVLASKKARLGVFARLVGNVLIVIIRSVPTIVYALLLIVAFGLGPATGAIALSLASVGIMAKLTVDTFDSQVSISKKPLEAIGLSRFQVLLAGTIREHISLLLANISFVFDVAFRYSLILGIVGAGGLGTLLLEALRIYDYGRVTVIVAVIFIVISFVEVLSKQFSSRD